AFELQSQGLTFRSFQWNPFYKVCKIGIYPCAGTVTVGATDSATCNKSRNILYVLQPEEFPCTGSKIKRQISSRLKDADLSYTLTRNTTGCNIRHSSRFKCYPRIGNVYHR